MLLFDLLIHNFHFIGAFFIVLISLSQYDSVDSISTILSSVLTSIVTNFYICLLISMHFITLNLILITASQNCLLVVSSTFHRKVIIQ
jgi:flagellar biosynthesis protein FliR